MKEAKTNKWEYMQGKGGKLLMCIDGTPKIKYDDKGVESSIKELINNHEFRLNKMEYNNKLIRIATLEEVLKRLKEHAKERDNIVVDIEGAKKVVGIVECIEIIEQQLKEAKEK